ncbi:MAG TPA: hypothetical protein VKW78_05660 [Terriglobales bacterium]|nr:hypothetical protein [Terriglobales bacterium]
MVSAVKGAGGQGCLIYSASVGLRLNALLYLARLFTSDNLTVLPIGLPFAPKDLLQKAKEHHLENGNHCTIVADLLPILSPQLYTREGLGILSRIPLAGFSPERGVDAVEKFKDPGSGIKGIRSELGIAPDAFVILYPARHAALKRHLVLLSAFAEILGQNTNARLILVGEPTEPEVYDRVRTFLRC